MTLTSPVIILIIVAFIVGFTVYAVLTKDKKSNNPPQGGSANPGTEEEKTPGKYNQYK